MDPEFQIRRIEVRGVPQDGDEGFAFFQPRAQALRVQEWVCCLPQPGLLN